jgi:two-component system CheB/CheR fusion protein
MKSKSKRQSPRRAATKMRKQERPPPPAEQRKPGDPVFIVGIGASAGGLEAFQQLLASLPNDSGMGFVLVQHLAPDHESVLSELLTRSTKMPVVEVREGVKVQADRVYVIPPNKDMSIVDGVLHLAPLQPNRARRMPIDLFLRSLAEDQHGRAIGVILSGTASDGTLGLHDIKALGGVTFAQDEGSAKYNAMPRNAIAAGNVDFVLPPAMIARELDRIAKHIHVFVSEEPERPEAGPGRPEEDLGKILAVLRNVSRVDFSFYKPGTIKRRINRRMFLRKIENIPAYLQYLRKNPEEVEALFNDVLINVTGFFRDPEAFEALRSQVFPLILNKKEPNSPIRIWVPGCSTGEEPYSLAIEILDYLGDMAANNKVQIFATDVSEAIIQKARVGIYSESIALDMPADRLRRYFQKSNGGYQISKTIRDMCVFAKQDITKDPPFSKLDMISCRNVMIYMGQVLQKRIIPVFHYALVQGGILFLGSAETTGGFGDLFKSVDRKYKIYTKRAVSARVNFDLIPQYKTENVPEMKTDLPAGPVDLQRTADQILLSRYIPACVMVDEKLDIVRFIGQTGRFLEPAAGDASLNVLKMVKTGLHAELRLAFQNAKRDGTSRREAVLVEYDGGLATVNFEVISVNNTAGKERYYLVVFEEATRPSLPSPKRAGTAKEKPKKKSGKIKTTPIEAENSRLKEELDDTREYLQSIIEEQRTTNEELRSANEEIQSSNEELQSINEELETAKEELQSTNEELTTVNEELQNRNDELSQLNADLNNLLGSVNIPIIMLGNDLRIRRFTSMAEKVMNLIPADIGRPISDIKPNLKAQDLQRMISHVINSLEILDTEIEDSSGRWYSMRIRPYRTLDNKIDGVVIVFLDLDVRLQPKTQ